MVGVIASVVPKLKQTELRFRRGLSGFRFGMRSDGPESASGGELLGRVDAGSLGKVTYH